MVGSHTVVCFDEFRLVTLDTIVYFEDHTHGLCSGPATESYVFEYKITVVI
jgi:hypothetical protein